MGCGYFAIQYDELVDCQGFAMLLQTQSLATTECKSEFFIIFGKSVNFLRFFKKNLQNVVIARLCKH